MRHGRYTPPVPRPRTVNPVGVGLGTMDRGPPHRRMGGVLGGGAAGAIFGQETSSLEEASQFLAQQNISFVSLRSHSRRDICHVRSSRGDFGSVQGSCPSAGHRHRRRAIRCGSGCNHAGCGPSSTNCFQIVPRSCHGTRHCTVRRHQSGLRRPIRTRLLIYRNGAALDKFEKVHDRTHAFGAVFVDLTGFKEINDRLTRCRRCRALRY